MRIYFLFLFFFLKNFQFIFGYRISFLNNNLLHISANSKRFSIPLKHYPLSNQILEFLLESQKENLTSVADFHERFHKNILQNYKNSQFIGEIAIGESKNTFKVIFDTGSSNIWINSIYCLDDGCMSHKKYNGSLSKNYVHTNKTLSVEFGSGGLKGHFSQDTVFLGDICIENQAFIEIYQEFGEVFSKVAFDGIIGMGFKALSAHGSTPIFDQIIEKNRLNLNVFSFILNKNKESQLTIGGYDEKFIDGTINYHNLVEEIYWTIKMEKILINGQDSKLCNNCKAIIDTGTSLITGPTKEIKKLTNLLKIHQNCQKSENLPEISFVIDGISYTINSKDYLVNDDHNNTNLTNSSHENKKNCMILFIPMDIPDPRGPAWILGDLFLMNYLSIFDRDNNRIGLARVKNS